MPREIRNEIKRDLANKLLMRVMNNLDSILNSDIAAKSEYQGINDYGLMKAAFAVTVREPDFMPRHSATQQFVDELLATRTAAELEHAVEE
jgi:hypothetical protein